jgi:Protein of unknown function (DUF1759)
MIKERNINLTPFDSKHENLEQFWISFDFAVDSNENISFFEKSMILKSLVESGAKSRIQHSPLNEEEYKTSVAVLKKAYNDPYEATINIYKKWISFKNNLKPSDSLKAFTAINKIIASIATIGTEFRNLNT